MKLSIIVPAYNIEGYIERCLDSIIRGGRRTDEFEIVVVDDGSTDRSPERIAAIDWSEVNHKVISQENQGLSGARNTGTAAADGDYVWFVDGDDWIEDGAIDIIIAMLDDADIYAFPEYFIDDGNTVTRARHKCMGCMGCVPFYIFRRAWLERSGLSFMRGIIYEDSLFMSQALYLSGKTKISDLPAYHYSVRQESITKSRISEKNINSLKTILATLYSFMRTSVRQEDRIEFSGNISHQVNALMYTARCSGDDGLYSDAARFIENEGGLFRTLKDSPNLMNRIWYYVSRLCCGKAGTVYSVMYNIRYRRKK